MFEDPRGQVSTSLFFRQQLDGFMWKGVTRIMGAQVGLDLRFQRLNVRCRNESAGTILNLWTLRLCSRFATQGSARNAGSQLNRHQRSRAQLIVSTLARQFS